MLPETLKQENQNINIIKYPVAFVKKIVSIYEQKEICNLSETKAELLNEWQKINSLMLKTPFRDVVSEGKSKGKARIAEISDETYLREWLKAPPNESRVVLYHQTQSLSPLDGKGNNHIIRIDFRTNAKDRNRLAKILIEDTFGNDRHNYLQRIGLEINFLPSVKIRPMGEYESF